MPSRARRGTAPVNSSARSAAPSSMSQHARASTAAGPPPDTPSPARRQARDRTSSYSKRGWAAPRRHKQKGPGRGSSQKRAHVEKAPWPR